MWNVTALHAILFAVQGRPPPRWEHGDHVHAVFPTFPITNGRKSSNSLSNWEGVLHRSKPPFWGYTTAPLLTCGWHFPMAETCRETSFQKRRLQHSRGSWSVRIPKRTPESIRDGQFRNGEYIRLYTPLKTNMSPENQWLEDVFPTKIVPFLGTC